MLIPEIFTRLQITNNIAQEAGKKVLPYQGYYKKGLRLQAFLNIHILN